MANTIDHHPIRFDYSAECNLVDHNWMQYAEYGDVQQFQLEIGPCAYEQNAISNGSFTSSSDWTISGSTFTIDTVNGWAQKVTGSASNIRQTLPSADDVYWRVTMDFVVTTGQFAVTYGTEVNIVDSSGSYEFWITADSVTSLIVSADGAASGTFTNVVAVPINLNFEVYVVDANGTTQHTYDKSDFNFTNQWATLGVDWQDIAVGEGCYTLQVSDPCNCVQGGFVQEDFETDTGAWSTDSTWTISGGSADFNGSSATGQALMSGVLCAGTEYEVEYTLANMAGNTFYVQLGSATGTTQNSNGTFTETITCTNSSSFKMVGGGLTSSLSVTDLTIRATARTVQHTSVPIRVLESAADCTHKITVCNDSDGMGAGFEFTGFSPMLRIGCQYAHGGATATRNSYEFSTGKKSTTYYRGRKNKSLTFAAPSYVHDFMIHLGGYDHVYIDGTEVFIEDDEYPTISWNKETDMGGVTLTLREKDVLIENRRKSSKVEACDPNGNPITTGNNEIIFLPDGGRLTTG
jgi:hypothetical protein